jgi:signal peptidase I
VGDLVVGARSGSGEPEKEEAKVPPVDNADSDGSVPVPGGEAAPGAAHGYGPVPGHGGSPAGGNGFAPGNGVPQGTGLPEGGGVPEGGAHPQGSGLAQGDGMPQGNGHGLGQGGGVPHEPAPGLAMAGAHRAGAGGPTDPSGPGDDEDGDRPASSSGSKPRSFWKELPLLVGIALVLALLIKTFLVQAFSIPSDSMQDTLQRGDRVLVDKLTPWFGSTPSRGEVVVFHDPGGWLPENPPASSNPVVRGLQKGLSFIGLMPSADEKDLIKRVIGVGGDTVQCKGSGPVTVNGKALIEPYVFPGNTACTPGMPFKVTVPKGHIWVMGDHRQDSLDSRFHMTQAGHGFVPNSDVVGRAIVIAWPINRWDWLEIPSTFSQPGISAAGTAVPAAAGLAGALPLVLVRRRRLMRNSSTEG